MQPQKHNQQNTVSGVALQKTKKQPINQWHKTTHKLAAKIQSTMLKSQTVNSTYSTDFPLRQNQHYQQQQQQQQQQQHVKAPPSNQWRKKMSLPAPASNSSNSVSTVKRNNSLTKPHNISTGTGMVTGAGTNTGKGTPTNQHNNNHNRQQNQHHTNKHNYHLQNSSSSGGSSGNSNSNSNNSSSSRQQNLKWVKDSKLNEELSKSLQSTLQSYGVYENSDGIQKRRNVLDNLENLLCAWVDSIGNNASGSGSGSGNEIEHLSYPRSRSKVRLISFGSYRLGVHSPSSDLDILALCPPHVSREHFFSSLIDRLRKDSRVKGLHPIPGAYTPVIKFFMNELQIDLLFVRLIDDDKFRVDDNIKRKSLNNESMMSGNNVNVNVNMNMNDILSGVVGNKSDQSVISSFVHEREEFQIDDSMLIGLDEPSVRSLNGVRVAQFLLSIIPNKNNFCIVLRTVKQWACAHGLYSNVLGFLGGINWAILVAWVCKRNANASPPTLLKIFFQTFSKWRWPAPVLLSKTVKRPPPGVMPLTIWDPAANPRDRAHLMPIITPAYPSMNSSYNVGKPQLRRFQEELHNGDKIMNQIADGKVEWSELLKGNDFFKEHIHYIQVSIISENTKDHRSWFGLCESRLRILIAGFESPNHGCLAYPFAKFFTRKIKDTKNPIIVAEESIESSKIVTTFFIALRFSPGVNSVDLKSCTDEFVYIANSWKNRKSSMDLKIDHVLQKDLPEYVTQNDTDDLENLLIEEEIDVGVKVTDSTSFDNKNLEVEEVRFHVTPDDVNVLASPLKKAKITKLTNM